MTQTPFALELDRPSTLAGQACGPLAAWFIALLAMRARSSTGTRVVERSELRARLRTDGAYPMALSRLFAAAQTAGVAIGWGWPVGGDPSLCDPRHRRDGPFWITRATARRLRILRGGRPFAAAELRRWLQVRDSNPRASAAALAATPATGPARFWFDLLLARQQAEEDGASPRDEAPARHRPDVPPLGLLADAATLPVQRGWALFTLARQARRADDLAAAREALQQAEQAVRTAADPRSRALRQLCALGLAWCAYQARDGSAAQRLLDRAFFSGGAGEGWRGNPRLCAEVLNLRGLLRRARLAARWPRAPADDEVAGVFDDLEAALVASIEADAFTLMEGVASNLGYSIWLLRVVPETSRPTTDAGHAIRLDAIRWILLSEWYRQRHALSGHSLWNVLSVCRIARGGLALSPVDDESPVDTSSSLTLSTVRRELSPLGDLLQARGTKATWLDVSARLLDELTEAPAAHGRLETAAVMLEHLWQLALSGTDRTAAVALARELRRRIADLAAPDRVMFERELPRIEAQLGIRSPTVGSQALSSPKTPAAPKTRSSRHRA